MANPRFRDDQMEHKTNPEGDAKKFPRRETRETACCEEDPDDRTNGGNRQMQEKTSGLGEQPLFHLGATRSRSKLSLCRMNRRRAWRLKQSLTMLIRR